MFQANSNNLYKFKKTLEDKYEKKQEDKMETSGVVYEVDCNYTVEIQLKYVENWKKQWKKIKMMEKNCKESKNITGLSQHMKTTGPCSAWNM